ncbi:MAG TPA: hypothetical protein PKY56_00450 [Candidatus Kapabacteria bacterium]|nr:hypothetical protein [Candidatus Kapabacteria bacterium]HPO63209.1 hypothetical protein [Candidatus Kapabacteria bacterium]
MEIKEKLFQLHSEHVYSVIIEALSEYVDNNFYIDEENLSEVKEAKDLLEQLKIIKNGCKNNQITTLFAEEKINSTEYIQIIFRLIKAEELKSIELDKFFDYR